ncbi:MAG TPA: hypothetical protein VKG44_09390, partial [Candidatus Baltobacteraceae bacterium]|nr:hypothetical protein [Candidatus Baltobacteraceae bacterium]
FDERWAFTSQSTATGANFINDLHPANGSQVGSAFDVTGHTQPGSRVHIDAVASTNVANFVQISQGHMAFDVQAGPDGSFHAHVDVGNTGAAVIDVRAQSTAPDGSTAVRTLRLRP